MFNEDLDELLMAYLDHIEEQRQSDFYMKGSTQRFYNLRSDFERKYNVDDY